MAIRDTVTESVVQLAFNNTINTATTTNGSIIDTANASAVSFYLMSSAFTAGTFKLSFQEGDESTLSDAVDLPDDKLVTIESDQDAVETGLTAVTAVLTNMTKAGVFSNKRYVRPRIVSTNSPNATVQVLVRLDKTDKPAE